MKRYFLIVFSCYFSTMAFAQSEMSVFTATGRGGVATTFVTDYQSMGINPSNLGWEAKNEKMISFGLLEGGFSIYSEALVKSDLVSSLKAGDSKFTYDEKVKAARDFTNAGFAANIDISLLSIGVQPGEEIGGFAFGIKDRFQWYSEFSEDLSDILFLGYNAPYFDSLLLVSGAIVANTDSVIPDSLIKKGLRTLPMLFSDIMDDSRMSMSWYREYNFSYGRKILSNDNMKLYAGVGIKYLAGIAILEARVNNGELEAFSAITPAFNINYGDSAKANNPSTVEGSGFSPKAVGSGIGFDLGFNAVIGEKLKIGVAINDIGSITWNGNVYQALDDSLLDLTSPGFDSYNLFAEAQNVMGEDGMFEWSGVTEKKVSLPTNMRLGASFVASEKFEAGLDIIIPMNDVAGSYGKALMGFGADITPIPWLRLSTGISTGGNYGFNLPLGAVVMIGEGTWEIGVASRDVMTFFAETRPTISLSTGFLRFRF